MTADHQKFFEIALAEAERGSQKNEVPIGAVIVKDGEILSRAHNESEKRGCFVFHGELLAIQKATKKLQSKYLYDADLYVTLEPCRMCVAAAQLSRIRSIYYLAKSKKFGRSGPAYFKTSTQKFRAPALTQRAVKVLEGFFSRIRLK